MKHAKTYVEKREAAAKHARSKDRPRETRPYRREKREQWTRINEKGR